MVKCCDINEDFTENLFDDQDIIKCESDWDAFNEEEKEEFYR